MSDMMDMAGGVWDRAILIVMITLSLFVLFRRATQVKKILLRNKWLVVLFGYLLLSIIWSNFPEITMRRGIRSLGVAIIAMVALTEADPMEAVRTVLQRVYFFHIPLSIITIRYFRTIGVDYNWSGTEEMWTGLATHKNCLGQVAMCSALLCTWQVLRKWKRKKLTIDMFILILSLWVLRGSPSSHSSTAILGFVGGLGVLFGLQLIENRPRRAKRIVLASITAFVVLVPLVNFGIEAFGSSPVQLVLNATGRDITLTDRTILWTDVLNNAAKHPVLGVGFGAFWVGSEGYDLYPMPNWHRKTPGWRPNQGHNGYIDTFVETGAVGLILVLIVLARAFVGRLDELEWTFEFARLRLALLVSIVINNLAEASLLKGTHSLWLVLLLVAINLPRPARKPKSPVVATVQP